MGNINLSKNGSDESLFDSDQEITGIDESASNADEPAVASDEQELSLSDALAEMKADNEADEPTLSAVDALAEMETDNASAQAEAADSVPAVSVDNGKMLKTIAKLDQLMGEFLSTMATVDRRFDKLANKFFYNAREISNRRHVTDDDKYDMIVNFVAGVGVKGVGSLWTAIQTERKLHEIVGILAKEAEVKLETIRELQKMIDESEDACFNQFIDSKDQDEAIRNLGLTRASYYSLLLANYLISVYEAALAGRFTDMAYPTLYDVNVLLISSLVGLKWNPDGSIDDEKAREALNPVIEHILKTLTDADVLPTIADVAIAGDPQLTSTAIHLCARIDYPDTDEDGDYLDDPEHFPDDDNIVIPASYNHVKPFTDIVINASNADSPFAERIKDNPAYNDLTDHIEGMIDNQEEFDSRVGLYVINSILFGIITFLGCWVHLDMKWYWSLLLGIVAVVVGCMTGPLKKLTKNHRAKAVCIERSLSANNKTAGGYTEVIDFKKISTKNSNVFIGAVIGALIGGFTNPIPGMWIVGLLVGAWLGKASGVEVPDDYDWKNMKMGSNWKAKAICFVFSVAILVILYYWIF